jgi:nitrogen fixation/metabolism regulation signal transduction histidine kinase
MRKTIFRKTFFVTLLASLLPLSVLWFYLLHRSFQGANQISVALYFFGLAIALATFGAYFLSRRISQPITHFTRTATEIARGNFNERVNVESQDELGRLAKIFNYMT